MVFFVSVRQRSWRTPVLVFATLEYAIHALNHLVDVGDASSDLVGWFDFFSLALIALSRDMGLGCVIEGVETAEELAALLYLGGFEIQGYYYSPPLPEAELAAYLDAAVAVAAIA